MARIVLVADDSPTIQKRALGILKGEGFEVETVSNGVAAIKRLAVLHPVVILADVSMPGRDGYEVCEFVKKSPELTHVPVLLVASDMEPYDRARGAEVGADGIIKKPFEAHELASIVTRFAAQFAAASLTHPASAPAPPQRETAREFTAFSEEPDYAPTVVQHIEPDFSAAAGGVAFAEPAAETPPASSAESQPGETEAPFTTRPAETESYAATVHQPPSAFAEETPLAVEDSSAANPSAPPHSPLPEPAPTHFERLESAPTEPIVLEDHSAQAPETPAPPPISRTMIFRTPLDLIEPVWKDEAVPAPPAPEPTGDTTLPPQREAEAPVAAQETPLEPPPEPSPVAAQETPLEPPPEPLPMVASVTATSLDSFSLDDAAAGQVHFASEMIVGTPVDIAPLAPTVAVPITEYAGLESTPEAVYGEIAHPEAAPEGAPAEMAPPETARAEVESHLAPPEAAPEAAHAQVVPFETAPGRGYREVALAEIVLGRIDAHVAPPQTAPEETAAAIAPPTVPPQGGESQAAPVEAMPEAVDSQTAFTEAVTETIPSQTAAPEAPPEVIESQAPPVEAAPEAFDLKSVFAEAVTETIHPQAVASETAPEVVESQAPPVEAAPEAVESNAITPEAAPVGVETQAAPHEATPEAVHPQVTTPIAAPDEGFWQTALHEAVPGVLGLGIASGGAVLAAIESHAAPPEVAPQVADAHAAPAEAVPEATLWQFAPAAAKPEIIDSEIAPVEAPVKEPSAAPAAEIPAPPSSFDWDLFYSIIHKVVTRMSPPILSKEAVEEIARRLADEIATEITVGTASPHP